MAILHHPYHPTKSQPSTTILLLLLLTISIQNTFSLSETEALIQFKKSLQNTDKLDSSWSSDTTPCGEATKWTGILCHKNATVGMRLESMGLSGQIDIEALLNLKALRSISFSDNKFDGPLPDLNRLGSLKALFLSSNQFSGEIPQDYFAHMNSLKKVWLPNNNFSGPIPSSLAQSQSLIELHLENNQFSGPLPNFSQPFVDFNVSNNKLEGEIPAGLAAQMNKTGLINKGVFGGNSGLCGPAVGKECGPKPDVAEKTAASSWALPNGGANDSSKAITAVATFFGVVFLMLVVLVIVMRSKKDDYDEGDSVREPRVPPPKPANESEKLVDIPLASPPAGSAASSMASLSRKEASSTSGSGRKSSASKKGMAKGGINANTMGDLVMVNEEKGTFGLQDLMKAAAEVLGNGGMGSAYKAVMANGVSVTVKRTREMNKLGKEAFDAELRKLAGLKHKNLLPPLAYYYRKEEKLLVYEFKPKKSLLYNLHGDGKNTVANLDWSARRKIIHGVAQGLGFLHTQLSSSELPHGNLKSSNILIDDDGEPLMAEYGFSSITSSNQQAQLAYKAPEVAQSQKVTPKCDVYCFGVVVLEILTGKYPSLYLASNKEGGIDVVQWVVSAVDENREAELLDPKITKESDHVDEMVVLLRVGATCVEANPDKRPDMFEAIKRVEKV